jgi:hypothetical protein
MTVMSVDDLLIAIIIAGLGLSGACLKAEFLSWRRHNAAQRNQQANLRAWHTKLCIAALLVVAGVMTLSGCISPKYKMARKNTPPAEALSLVFAQPPVQLQVNAVIVYKGPGSWKREALWDEYVITFVNQAEEPLTIAAPMLIGFASTRLQPGVDPWVLEKQSKTLEQRYRSAGLAFARTALPGVAILGAGSASVMASGIFSAGAATAATATVIALPVYYIVVLSVNHVNKSAVKAEFNRRRLVWPLTLGPGETRSGSLFYPMVPSPQSLNAQWTGSTDGGSVIASLQSLRGLHVPSAAQ